MGKKYWTAKEKLQAILYVQSSTSVVQACRELRLDPSMYYKLILLTINKVDNTR